MKKIFILLTNIVLGAALVMGTSSCSEDFINETKRDAMSSDWLNEPEGLASMARSPKKKNLVSATIILLSELEALLSCLIFKAETKRKAILNRGNYD